MMDHRWNNGFSKVVAYLSLYRNKGEREWMEWGRILFDARQEALLRLIVVKVMDYLGKLLPRQKETDG